MAPEPPLAKVIDTNSSSIVSNSSTTKIARSTTPEIVNNENITNSSEQQSEKKFLNRVFKAMRSSKPTSSSNNVTGKPPKPAVIHQSHGASKYTSQHMIPSSRLANNYDSDDGLLPTEVRRNCTTNAVASKSTTKSTTSKSHYTSASVGLEDRLRLTQRSPSPALSLYSNASSRASSLTSTTTTTTSNFTKLQTPPRRIFPQTYTRGQTLDPYELRNLEKSPVVFDANLSFVLGCQKQPVKQTVRPTPSFEDPRTSSSYLSEKIQNFLKRTDHVQEEWTAMGKRANTPSRGRSQQNWKSSDTTVDSGRTTPSTNSSAYDKYDTIALIERQRERNSLDRGSSLGRSRSTQNILTKAFQLTKTLPSTPRSRSNSVARDINHNGEISEPKADDECTIQGDDDLDELSEITVDLAEERSTAHIATERLEAETGERLKLEKDLTDHQSKIKNLQELTEKLEMELICAKSDLNGISEDDDPDNEDDPGGGGNANNSVYKLKYERVARELEFTKRRLQTQHEHDLEQLVGLKKQLEKKLADAYEEVEEQRQVVGQWKRKAQKMTNEMNDLRMLLEEQNARNNLLEKKQRKFDTECQALQDAARQERLAKERFSREKDVLTSEKFTLEQTLADTRLDLELKEEKLVTMQRELEEMTFGGGTEEEFAQLRRSKNEFERRVKEQEEELDEMAGQVQLLEQAKLRLEMTLETMRKEARREGQQRDEELEEARGNAYKKIKALECQLETEHEERTMLLREKHELERRLSSMEDRDRVDRDAEEAINQKLRRELRKYKALLKDAQTQLERLKADTPGKTLIRQLRNQLEDAESARSLAMKARQTAEAELAEVQAMFEESNRARHDAEDRANAANRDRTELQAQIEENEEELAELMKKYSTAVKQLNSEQIAVSEYEFKLSELEAERNNLKEQVSELQHRLENVENMGDPSAAMMSKRLELRTKELESRLELEQATRARLEVQVNRHKEALEKIQNEVSQSKLRELQAQDAVKKSQKSLREMREEFHAVTGREQDSVARRKDLEKKLEQMESESTALKNDLRLALQRIADLQQAMEEEGGEDELSESEESLSSVASISDLEERLKPIQIKRNINSTTTTNGTTPAGSTTRTLVNERDENSPRVILTTPSSPHIHKMANAAKATTGITTTTTKARVLENGA